MFWDEEGEVLFDEVECIFEANLVWKQGNEMLMYEFLWNQLEKRFLTSYTNETQHKIILLYPLILISMYKTFVSLGTWTDGNCAFYDDCDDIASISLKFQEIGYL